MFVILCTVIRDVILRGRCGYCRTTSKLSPMCVMKKISASVLLFTVCCWTRAFPRTPRQLRAPATIIFLRVVIFLSFFF